MQSEYTKLTIESDKLGKALWYLSPDRDRYGYGSWGPYIPVRFQIKCFWAHFDWKVWLETLLEPENMSSWIFTNSSSILVQLLHQSLLGSPAIKSELTQVYNWKCWVETICLAKPILVGLQLEIPGENNMSGQTYKMCNHCHDIQP